MQLRVRVMALGNGRTDPPDLMWAPLGVELQECDLQCSGIRVDGQGSADGGGRFRRVCWFLPL